MEMIIIDNNTYLPVVALSPKQAALALGFTKETSYRGVLRWLDSQGIKTHKINGENRVLVEELMTKLNQLREAKRP